MSENSKIEWTNHTFNPWRGCTKVSPGCAHCYAETLSKRNPKVLGTWGKGQPRVLASEAMWRAPLKWDKKANEDGAAQQSTINDQPSTRPKVFCASLADWLDDEVPIEWRARLLALIHATPHLDWLLLTKRPANFFRLVSDCLYHDTINQWVGDWVLGRAPANVWIGTTVEDQARADERIPQLLAIPARVRFLSCEPLLEAVDITPSLWGRAKPCVQCSKDIDCECGFVPRSKCEGESALHWVICGGESGPHARAMHINWARGLRDQCAAAGVPFFFKQWGEHDECAIRVGKKAAGRLLDGVKHNAFP